MADEVLIRCHCGQLNVTVQLRDQLPCKGLMCHCNICRHVTGALTFTGILLLDPPADIFKTKLQEYATSSKITRYFCPDCGSHVCYYVVEQDRWCVCDGAIEEVMRGKSGSLQVITGHEFVGDTGDGGLSWTVPDVPCFFGADNEEPMKDIKSELERNLNKDVTAQEQVKLPAECHCGQVKLLISKRDPEYVAPNDTAFGAEGSSSDKWDGGICACRSCRLSVGQILMPWLSNVPFEKVAWSDGSAYDESKPHSSVKRFQSSDHAYREFCGKCGALVTWHSSKEPGTIDIAAGLLRASEGSLAKRWINWRTTSVHHTGDAVDTALVETVERNLDRLENA